MRFVVVIVLAILMLACGNRKSTNLVYIPSLAELDSMYIKLMIDSLDKDYFGNMNEGLPREEWTNFGGWYNGEVKYSGDSLLRIYSFIGEGCGAYCSPLYTTIIKYDTLEIEEWFLPVDTIFKLADNDYLVVCKGLIRLRGIEFSHVEQAYQITVNEQITFNRIVNVGLSSFIVNTEGSDQFINLNEEVGLLDYFDKDQSIYAVDFGYAEGSYSDSLACFRTVHKYVYNNGRFEQQFVDGASEIRKITE